MLDKLALIPYGAKAGIARDYKHYNMTDAATGGDLYTSASGDPDAMADGDSDR